MACKNIHCPTADNIAKLKRLSSPNRLSRVCRFRRQAERGLPRPRTLPVGIPFESRVLPTRLYFFLCTCKKSIRLAPAFAPNMSRALSRDKFGQTPCFSGPGLIIWPASLPRWTCLDRRASSQSNIRGFAGRAAAASDRRGSPPRALYVAGVASQFVATAGGVTFGLKSLPAGVPREQRPRE